MDETSKSLLDLAEKLNACGVSAHGVLHRALDAERAVLEWRDGHPGNLPLERIIRWVPVFVFSPRVQAALFNLREEARTGDDGAAAQLKELGAVIGAGSPARGAEKRVEELLLASELLSRVNKRAESTGNLAVAYAEIAFELNEADCTRWPTPSGPGLREWIKRTMTRRPTDMGGVQNRTKRPKGKPGPKPNRGRSS
jgi:hypothetical protein